MLRARYIPLVVGLALVATACPEADPGPDPDDDPPAAAPTDAVLRIGIGGAPDSLNPGNGVLSEAWDLYDLMYDTPIGRNFDGEYVPLLAESWEVDEAETTWTVTIREGVTFHDGEPLTAEDVAFTLELYRDTWDFPYLSAYPDVFETIEAPDDTTVVITTAEPIGNFESRLVFAYIVPKHIWSELDDPVAFENEEMIGSGPFQLHDSRRGEFTHLVANEDHWDGAPAVSEVIFRTIETSDARVRALQTGEVDLITEFPATALRALEDDDAVTVATGAALDPSLRNIAFNHLDPDNCPEDAECSGHPALRDPEVRHALVQAIDKERVIDVVLGGMGTPGLTLVPDGLGPWYADQLATDAFDLEAAAQRLEDAGYVDTTGDGIRECREDQDCDDLTFRFYYANDIDTAPRETELVAGWWQQIGVRAEIQGIDPDTLTSICCPNFGHDIYLWGWVADPDPANLLIAGKCDEIESGWNETGYCNPTYDELYAQQAVETDLERRMELIHEMQRILVEDAVHVAVYYPQEAQAYRPDRFTGWTDGEPLLKLHGRMSLLSLRPVG
jgi:peptide/nickel transport system substrate-binding protein